MKHTLTLTVAALALALAACSPEPATAPETPPAETPPVTEPAPTTPPAGANVLSAQGYGPLRIGMTRAEVVAALGEDANPNAVGGADPASCDQFRPARAPEGLLVMINDGVLTSIWLTRTNTIPTDRGFKIGDTAAAVKAAYGASATAESHKYEAAPSEYITAWTSADHTSAAARGIKYEVGGDGKVKSIAAGGPTISYVEGCA